MEHQMSILVIGGGSMGRRRMRDALALRPGQVFLYEPDKQRCDEVAELFGIQGFTDLDEALAQNPSAMIVSTPPALHDRYIRLAVERGIHVFAELPFVFDTQLLTELSGTAKTSKIVLGVSATIRYYPPFRLIHDLIRDNAVGKRLYLEYSLGNYLPDWHPHEDYRKFYAKGDPRAGGSGVDMILHEMHAIQWWLGPVDTLSSRVSKVSELEIAGPDTHDALLTFKNGCRGYFHHDVIEQGTRGRHIRLVGDAGTIEWGQHEPTIRVYKGDQKSEQFLTFDQAEDWDEAMRASKEMVQILARTKARSGAVPSGNQTAFTYESCYLREMRHFLDAAEGKHPYTLATIEEELHNVRTFHRFLDTSEQYIEHEVRA
jgi:predicted dehydrogenase